ncbi:hypothetical protein MHB46_02335 [Paenibacillus sp. FSL H7-0703]|uniref:AbiJ-NTD4 domain-containing protein n=1 Tax=Paenibacillus sp. FSL H7-0703 TaxID=2921438 RepID=UPI0030FC097E
MKFSERIGKKPVKVDIQIESMDDDLRKGLWNCFYQSYLSPIRPFPTSGTKLSLFFESLWTDFFKETIDKLPDEYYETEEYLKGKFFRMEWYEVYDCLEFVLKTKTSLERLPRIFFNSCNKVLEKELSAYRIVGTEITQMTDKNEIQEIEESLVNSAVPHLKSVYVHLSTALSLLSDRKSPDYRNSIKESISAVESISKIIAGDRKAELGKALKVLSDKIGLHNGLKAGFSSIYGYTSDEGGIRHAMSDEKEIYFEDAKYMLVACSAFVNYLIMKAERAGIIWG